jgi:hypothetical protein
MKHLLSLLAIAALVFALACGGDDDDDSGSPTPGQPDGTPTTVPTPTPTLPPLRPDFTPDASTPGLLPTPDSDAIVVESPQPNTEIRSPLIVRGTATEAAGDRVVVSVESDGDVVTRQGVDLVDGAFEVELVFNMPEDADEGAVRVVGEATGSGVTRQRTVVAVTLAESDVIVDSPKEGDASTSPLNVRGEARSQDGIVHARLLDASGDLIAETEAEVAPGAERAPFQFDFPFTVDNETTARLEVYVEEGGDEVALYGVLVGLRPGSNVEE